MYSFQKVFTNRGPPTFWCENHGREGLEDADISGTVGWFNTLVPVHVSPSPTRSIEKTVREVQTFRQSIPDNGGPYFAYQYLHPDGRKVFREHSDYEVFFNYIGAQDFDRGCQIVKLEPLEMGTEAADIGPETQRLALIDVLVEARDGRLGFVILYNRHTRYEQQEQIKAWAVACEQTLVNLAGR